MILPSVEALHVFSFRIFCRNGMEGWTGMGGKRKEGKGERKEGVRGGKGKGWREEGREEEGSSEREKTRKDLSHTLYMQLCYSISAIKSRGYYLLHHMIYCGYY